MASCWASTGEPMEDLLGRWSRVCVPDVSVRAAGEEWPFQKSWRASLDSCIVTQALHRQPWPLTPASTQLYVNGGNSHIWIMLEVDTSFDVVCSATIFSCPKMWSQTCLRNSTDHFNEMRTFYLLFSHSPLSFPQTSRSLSHSISSKIHPAHHNCWTWAKAGGLPDCFRWCKVA